MTGTYLAPIVDGEIDAGEAGSRQPFVKPLAGLNIAGRDQKPRDFMQARIVADNQKGADGRVGLSDDGEDGIGAAFVKALVIVDGRERGKRFGHVLPCLSRAPRRRHDHSIGEESVMRHIGPNLGGILATARIERTIKIGHAGFGLFRTRMSKQHQTHGGSIDFLPVRQSSIW